MTWKNETTGDFNGDGDTDLLWHHTDGPVTVWEMRNGNYYQNWNAPSVSNSWVAIGSGDFDGDGDDDLLWRNDESLTIWEMQNHQYVTNHNLPQVATSWTAAYTNLDRDGDGDDDIIWQHYDGTIVTWEMQDNQFVAHWPGADIPPDEDPPPPPPPPSENTEQISTNGSDWFIRFSAGMPPQPSGSPWSFTLPTGSAEIDYLTTTDVGGGLLDDASAIRMTFRITDPDGDGDIQFSATEGSAPATVGLFIQRAGDQLLASQPDHRFWSTARVQLNDGTFTMEVPLDSSAWTNVFGAHNASGFETTLSQAANIGMTFGGQFFGHGIRADEPGTFQILSYDLIL